jgi:hypothetical protein
MACNFPKIITAAFQTGIWATSASTVPCTPTTTLSTTAATATTTTAAARYTSLQQVQRQRTQRCRFKSQQHVRGLGQRPSHLRLRPAHHQPRALTACTTRPTKHVRTRTQTCHARLAGTERCPPALEVKRSSAPNGQWQPERQRL